jgi:hypothetical protein
VYARVDSAAAAVAKLASSALTAAGVPFWLSEAGSLFSVFLGRTEPVRSFLDAKEQSSTAYAAFFHAMLDGGVYLPPSGYEAWFLSAAHDDEALSRIADALPAAAAAAAAVLDAKRWTPSAALSPTVANPARPVRHTVPMRPAAARDPRSFVSSGPYKGAN